MRRAIVTLCFCASLVACGTPSGATTLATATPVPPTSTPRPVATSAAIPPTPPPTQAPPAAATSSYSGARWHDIPTPGTITPHQEEKSRYAVFVAGSQQAVIKAYGDAYAADGWTLERREASFGSEILTYHKGGRRFVVSVGPDIGTGNVVVVIDDTL